MTKSEMETIIRFDEETHSAEINTSSKRVARKLEKMQITPYRVTKNGSVIASWSFRLPDYAVILKPALKMIRIGVKEKAEMDSKCPETLQKCNFRSEYGTVNGNVSTE